jgi:hypothetical protein
MLATRERAHPKFSDQQSPIRNLEHPSENILIDGVTRFDISDFVAAPPADDHVYFLEAAFSRRLRDAIFKDI